MSLYSSCIYAYWLYIRPGSKGERDVSLLVRYVGHRRRSWRRARCCGAAAPYRRRHAAEPPRLAAASGIAALSADESPGGFAGCAVRLLSRPGNTGSHENAVERRRLAVGP